jgi:hypothetical protein
VFLGSRLRGNDEIVAETFELSQAMPLLIT